MKIDLIRNYGDFGDAIIKNVFYDLEKKELTVTLLAININETYQWDLIRLLFKEVITFRFIQNEKVSNAVVLNAFIVEENEVIVFDFFPVENGTYISFNEYSDFNVKCKKINFNVLPNEV